MKQNFFMRKTTERFFGKYRLEEVACVSVGDWNALRAVLREKGFQEKDDRTLFRKDATLARIVFCDYVLEADGTDLASGLLRQRERCRELGERRLDTLGRACYILLLYKDRVTEEDVRTLKRLQTEALAFQRAAGPQRIGGTMLLVLADKSAEAGFFYKMSGPVDAVYDHGCRTLEEVFGELA